MKNLIQLFYANHVLLLFIALQVVCFSFLFRYNKFQQSTFVNSANVMVGSLFEKRAEISEYVHLSRINNELAVEIADLKNQDQKAFIKLNDDLVMIEDTLHLQVYKYTMAKVINNSVNRQSNYITLNRGSNHGLDMGMGVISNNNLVGIVKDVSEHYAVVLPLINSKFTASVKLKNTNEFGQVWWESEDDAFTATIKEIPKHAKLTPGDSIMTTGFSQYFPEGVLVGTIASFEVKPGDNFYTIKIDLAADFHALHYVAIVANLSKNEIQELEEKALSDD